MKKTILWDFDGVILDSMSIRDYGFVEIFKNFSNEQLDKLLEYHRENGGLSRYVKIRYFYEEILNESITNEKVQELASKFSEIMKERLVDKENLINDSLNFIRENYSNYHFHIVSGSDQTELRFLCEKLDVKSFFISIHGSPTQKSELVRVLMEKENYDKNNTALIGDSINDFDAAVKNDINFFNYNNTEIMHLGKNIKNFTNFKF